MQYHVTVGYEGGPPNWELDPASKAQGPNTVFAGLMQLGLTPGELGRILRSAAVLVEMGHHPAQSLDTAAIWERG